MPTKRLFKFSLFLALILLGLFFFANYSEIEILSPAISIVWMIVPEGAIGLTLLVTLLFAIRARKIAQERKSSPGFDVTLSLLLGGALFFAMVIVLFGFVLPSQY